MRRQRCQAGSNSFGIHVFHRLLIFSHDLKRRSTRYVRLLLQFFECCCNRILVFVMVACQAPLQLSLVARHVICGVGMVLVCQHCLEIVVFNGSRPVCTQKTSFCSASLAVSPAFLRGHTSYLALRLYGPDREPAASIRSLGTVVYTCFQESGWASLDLSLKVKKGVGSCSLGVFSAPRSIACFSTKSVDTVFICRFMVPVFSAVELSTLCFKLKKTKRDWPRNLRLPAAGLPAG